MTSDKQKEFFTEFKSEKGRFEKITDKITEKRSRRYLQISIENVAFLVIVLIVSLIIAFAFGVEHGKKIVPGQIGQEDVTIEEVIVSQPPKSEIVPVLPEIKEVKKEEPKGIYTIQLIAYKEETLAEREKNRLIRNKSDAFIIKSKNWYQVCAGTYATAKDAKIALDKFSKTYKGCFVRTTE